MTDDPREVTRVRDPVLILGAAAWLGLLLDPGGRLMQEHCLAAHSGRLPPTWTAVASLAAGWGLMLVAMMAPALILPVVHLRRRSFKRRRGRAVAHFAIGYGAVWMAVGGVLLTAVIALGAWVPNPLLPAVGAILLAARWQLSPAKQRCLNRCHAHGELAAFGAAAEWGALRFGASHGVRCAGSCWALMLAPMLLPRWHVAAMAVVAVLTWSERLERPRPPRWRWRGLGRAGRIAVAQARLVAQPLAQRLFPAS
ncbi:MAG TPA: DUF2182 domain-containing protein [Thermoanaerobaculia bacterium]